MQLVLAAMALAGAALRLPAAAAYRRPTRKPTRKPTDSPTTTSAPTTCECLSPSPIPDRCELGVLIDMMDVAVSADPKLLAQWTRAAFHEAGTFDQSVFPPEGGVNGCLMNHKPAFPCHQCVGSAPPFGCPTCPTRDMPQNQFLDAPLTMLETVKDAWHASRRTCIDVSSADVLQFAILFAAVRQSGDAPGLTPAKRATLIADAQWGRPDIPVADCDIHWTDNLPTFKTAPGQLSVPRCQASGGEIKDKMMDRNGFTAVEANALIGAHTIGLIRNTFAPSAVGPWVANGADTATPNGPIFDNAYHSFLINDIVANNLPDFVSPNVAPFTRTFRDWFKDDPGNRIHLDTDVILAFDSTDPVVHPHFRPDTQAFANDNGHFLGEFFRALRKMSSLGVTGRLSNAGPCEDPCGDTPTAAPGDVDSDKPSDEPSEEPSEKPSDELSPTYAPSA